MINTTVTAWTGLMAISIGTTMTTGTIMISSITITSITTSFTIGTTTTILFATTLLNAAASWPTSTIHTLDIQMTTTITIA